MPPPEIISKLEELRRGLEESLAELTPDVCRKFVAKHGKEKLLELGEELHNGILGYNAAAESAGLPLLGDELDLPRPPVSSDKQETLDGLRQLREMYQLVYAWFPNEGAALRGLAKTAILYARICNYNVDGDSEVAPDEEDLLWAIRCVTPSASAEKKEHRQSDRWWRNGDEPRIWRPDEDTDFEDPEEGPATA